MTEHNFEVTVRDKWGYRRTIEVKAVGFHAALDNASVHVDHKYEEIISVTKDYDVGQFREGVKSR